MIATIFTIVLSLIALAGGSLAIWYRHCVQRLQGEMTEMAGARTEAATQGAQVRARLENLQGQLAELETELSDYRDANMTFSEQNDQLRLQVDTRLERISKLEAEISGLQARSLIQVRHMVILDGMPNSGKTTFIERLVNPTATPEQLRSQASTLRPYHTGPVPLGWEVKDERMILHTVQFWDIAGENPAGLIDVLTDMARERAAQGANDHTPTGKAVALTIWNSSADVEKNLQFLSPARMHTIFGARITRQILSSIVVFLNKADELEDHLRQQGNPSLEFEIERQQGVIRDVVFERVLAMYPDLNFTVGSALTGAGIHATLGEIVKGLGISHLFSRGENAGELQAGASKGQKSTAA